MQKVIIVWILLVLSTPLIAQTAASGIPISIGYLGNSGYHPGIKIGAHFDLKSWESPTESFTKLKSFYVSPQIGAYVYPDVHTGYLVNADFGYKRIKSHNRRYAAFAVGLGFLNQSQITERSINLSDGSEEKIRENWRWFLPSLNYEFGRPISERLGWYGKFTYGYKMASARENSTVLFIELGVKFCVF